MRLGWFTWLMFLRTMTSRVLSAAVVAVVAILLGVCSGMGFIQRFFRPSLSHRMRRKSVWIVVSVSRVVSLRLVG